MIPEDMQEETKFKEKVYKDLDTLPLIWYFKTQQRSQRGIPDLIICLNGKFIAIELKTNRGCADKLQIVTIDKIRKARGFAFVSNPALWDTHFKLLKEICGG